MPWAVQLLDGPQTFGEVPGQPGQPRDHDDVAGLELLPEPVVTEDAALGGQPARALRLGDPDVAEDCGVHVATSPRGNQTSS